MDSEKIIEKKLNEDIKKMGGLSLKLITSFLNGLPDRLCLLPGGRLFFIELKSQKKKPEPLQTYWHKKLIALGFDCYVADTFEKLNIIIEKYK
jgi:hypothetical protein